MSLLLLWHPGATSGPGPEPEPTEETFPASFGDMGGAASAARDRRRRAINEDDEDLLAIIALALSTRTIH